MRFVLLALILAAAPALAAPARADVPLAIETQILPGFAGFAAATAALAATAAADCDPQGLRPAWNAAFDAWMRVGYLRIGPGEQDGLTLAIAFWPDPKGIGSRQQAALLQGADPAVLAPQAFAQQSVAVRGLFGLERVLWPAEPPPDPAHACALIRATAGDLAAMAALVDTGWRSDFADQLINPGPEAGRLYRGQTESRQVLYTQFMAGLEFVKDQRIGRPLGTFDQPRPERAEARASGRSVANIRLSLAALRDLGLALAPDSPRTAAAFDRALARANALDEDAFENASDPSQWLKLEILSQDVAAIIEAAGSEIGPALGVGLGFNAADGD